MGLLPFRKDVPLSLGEVQAEVNRMFDRFWHVGVLAGPMDGQDWAPPVDVREEPDRFVVRAEVPGLSTDEVDVSIAGESLIITGQKPSDRGEEEPEPGERYLRTERRFGRFCRTLPLPATVDFEKATAQCRKGVLEVILPKKEDARPKTISVVVED